MNSACAIEVFVTAVKNSEIWRPRHNAAGVLATMLARLTALQDAWTGTAASRFQGVVQEWQGTQQQVRASLDSIGAALGQAGTHYAEAEAANERMFL